MKAALLLLALTLTTLRAEDIKTLTGQEYKDATISRAQRRPTIPESHVNMGGTIRAITYEDDGPMVEMEVRCNNACWVRAHFTPDQAGPWTQFRPGNRLTFIGTIAGLRSSTLTITNCYLPR